MLGSSRIPNQQKFADLGTQSLPKQECAIVQPIRRFGLVNWVLRTSAQRCNGTRAEFLLRNLLSHENSGKTHRVGTKFAGNYPSIIVEGLAFTDLKSSRGMLKICSSSESCGSGRRLIFRSVGP